MPEDIRAVAARRCRALRWISTKSIIFRHSCIECGGERDFLPAMPTGGEGRALAKPQRKKVPRRGARAHTDLATALSNERQMMANEVHDSLAQGLTYMRMRMSLLRDAIRQGDEARALKYWDDVDSSLTNSHRRLRELITYFRTRMDPRGLVHALGEMSESFLDRTGVALEFSNRVPELHLPVGREVQVFHIVQEALANVCKHANAGHARLSLDRKDGGYEIAVEDDGVGMVADAAAVERGETGHYGLAIMRERARRLGGELTLESAPGAGTRVRLYFPAVQPQSEPRL